MMPRLSSLAFCLLLPVAAMGQPRGTITGFVYDAENDEGLPGVNVVVQGTYYGAATGIDGRFVISAMSPGQYTLVVTMIGYTKVQQTGVRVQAGQTTDLEIALQPTVLAVGQEVVVIGERPLFDIEETSSRKSIGSEEIDKMVVENAQEIVAQQVGVVQTDDEIHIRGGRSYENAYLVDGVSVQDPLSGTGFGLRLSADAIEEIEVITGGFNAEYGQAMSGVVNVKTKEGGADYHGSLSFKRDHFGDYDSDTPLLGNLSGHSPFSYNTDILEMSLFGPEPLTEALLRPLGLDLPGDFSFFVNGYMFIGDDFTKRAANQLYSSIFHGSRFALRQKNLWSGMYKLTWRLKPTQKLAASFNQSAAINQNTQTLQTNLEYVPPGPGYPYLYQENLDNFNTFTHLNSQMAMHWTHTLSAKTFYELKLSRYFAHLRSDVEGKHWTEYKEPQDIVHPPLQYFMDPDTVFVFVIPGDGFWDYGNGFTWRDHYVEEFTLKGDLTSQRSERHRVKAGFEATYREMQLVDIYAPWFGDLGLNNDMYRVFPNFGAAYIQDNIAFQGLIANLGLRLDYWFPGKYVEDAISNPEVITVSDATRRQFMEDTFELPNIPLVNPKGPTRFKARLSPRIGVSHPVSDNQMLFFSYGHFSKRPKPQFVYAKLGVNSAKSTFQRFGNPNLNPETTVAYELGLKHKFSENDVLTVTAYYRDIFDYVTTVSFRGSGRLSGRSFLTYLNLDYSRSRGMEVEYKKRAGSFFSGSISGSYSIATGKSSTPDDELLVARGTLNERPITEDFLIWDRPWQVSGNLNVFSRGERRMRLFGVALPTNWNLSIRLFAQAGKRYTPFFDSGDVTGAGRPIYTSDLDHNGDSDDPYGKTASPWNWVDANFQKYFDVLGFETSFMVEVLNIFNQKNSNIINPVTGRSYEFGDATPSSWNDPLFPDLQAPLSPFPFNPARYLNPRNVRLGVAVRF